MDSSSVFAVELHFFAEHKKDWLPSHLGEFVVIAETNVAGFYPDYKAALEAGLKKFGVSASFLIKQIFQEEPVYFIG